MTSVFLISQHRKSCKPSKNGAICASTYLLCAQRFCRSPVFNITFVQTSIAPCIADRSGTKVYVPALLQIQSYSVHKGSIGSDSTFVHYLCKVLKSVVLVHKGSIYRFFQIEPLCTESCKVLKSVVLVHKGSISCCSRSRGSIGNTGPTLRHV